eukprot:c21398_g1_i1 orf=443-1600(+)
MGLLLPLNRKLHPFRMNGWQEKDHVRPSWISRHRRFLFAIMCLFMVAAVLFVVDVPANLNARMVHYTSGCVTVEDTMRSLLKVGERYPGWSGGERTGTEQSKEFSRVGQEILGADLGNNLIRPKVLGVVGIQTGFGSIERRKALRETWLPSDPDGIFTLEQATGLAFRFVIGRTSNAKKMKELDEEIAKYKNFIRLDIEEEYLQLTRKTLAFFKAAYLLFDADFYVKADDDIYLRPDRLATLLARDRAFPRTYLGCMKKGPVIGDPKLKWYEPLAYMLGNEYFYHAYGPIYALSAEVVASLAVARNDSFRFFSNEDVTVGAWMLAINVNHEDNRDICAARCTATSIAVWDIPKCSGLCHAAERLRELHKMDICSKSPTLPADAIV